MKYNIIDFFRKCIFYTPVFRIGARQVVGLLQRAGIVKPKVSIIVAAYNIEVYIDECLRSFTNQYFLNLEIVVVDDGSADGTTNIIKSHMRKDFRVKLFRQKNQGLSLARNNGFAHSKGEFICYVDGDDKMERNAVSDAYNSLAKTGSDFTVSYYVREEGGEIEGAKKVISPPAYWIQYIHQKYRPKTSVEQFPALMQNSTAWGKLFRRSFLIDKDLQFIPGKLYEDQPFIAKAYSLSKNGVDILDKIHYFWRIVGTSISNTTFTYKDIRERIDSAKMSISIYKKYMSENVVQKRLIQYLSHDFLAPLRTLSEVENKTKWLDILREGLLFLMSNLKEENLEKVNPLSRAANELIITRQYDELIDFYKETAFENRAVYVKKVKDKPCMDVVQTFPKAKTVKHLKDLPLVQELIFLIENLYEIDPSQSNENHYTVLGWAFLTCLDPKLFDYYYEFIIDGKKVNYESFDYREVLKHDQSQSINFLSTGFKIKIPKNAKELILKLSAGGFEREKKIELQGVIDYLLKKSRGETELEKFTDEWANDAFATDELGTANREKLIRKHLSKGFGPVKKNTVVFRTYYGEKCVDSALAMHEDLVSRAKGKFKLYWGVKNEHVLVPKGGIGVIVGSKEWFKVLSTSEYIVDNVHQNDYFYKQKGQKILQTFHGYPFKQMGYADWKQKGLSQLRVESFQRRADEWDWVLAPAPYTEPLYKKAFKYNGKFIDKGYPRNDILFDEEKCQKINKDVRKKLGILSDKKVVLYAPTFRDYLSTDEFHSKMVSSISNYQKFTEALGSDCVLLIRGHMMNARSDASFEESEQVKDVTNWDDINDLIIASDLAILDYSSLRFDWAQTHKPMIFFVPDLEKYKAERQFLISYENTAPGPKTTTEDDLIQSVKNVDKWSSKYKAAYQKFLKEYTPNEDGKAARRVNKIVFGV